MLQGPLIGVYAFFIVGPANFGWRVTADVEVEVALDRRCAPVNVRVAESLGALRRKLAELLELGQHDPPHVHWQGEHRQTLMGVEPFSVIVKYEKHLVLDVYLREPFRELN